MKRVPKTVAGAEEEIISKEGDEVTEEQVDPAEVAEAAEDDTYQYSSQEVMADDQVEEGQTKEEL